MNSSLAKMRTAVFLVFWKRSILLTSLICIQILLGSTAQAQTPDCGDLPASWDNLVKDFETKWTTASIDFCQYKRFLALNTMLKQDIISNPLEYYSRIEPLQARGDLSEPVNFLLLKFQETWFGLSIDYVLSKEMTAKSTVEKVTLATLGGAVGMALILPRVVRPTANLMRAMRRVTQNMLSKRSIVYGSTSLLSQQKKLSLPLKAKGSVELDFVRPPLVRENDAKTLDPRTDGIFLQESRDDLIAFGVDYLVLFGAQHYISLAIKSKFPTWAGQFPTSRLARSWLGRTASPGLVGGSLASIPIAYEVNYWTGQLELKVHYDSYRAKLISLSDALAAALRSGQEMQIWTQTEILRNQVLLTEEVFSRSFNEGLGDIEEATLLRILTLEEDCTANREEILKTEKAKLSHKLDQLIKLESDNLKTALALVQETDTRVGGLANNVDDSLGDLIGNLLLLGKKQLNPSELSDFVWSNIAQELTYRSPNCEPPEEPKPPVDKSWE